ncbi:MAG: Stp1/IreP family PP2C-type Ser/Thr phosphatase [Gemmatimonadota bacterium]
MTSINWLYSADSHVGQVRTQNEDSFGADSPPGLFIVADGMGGHAAGEVASRLAVRCATEGVALLPRPSPVNVARERLRLAIADANQVILIEGQTHPERSGMGTTTTALLLSDEGWWVVGHVGDSRAYLVRDGSVERITEDHTYVQELVNQGRLSDEEARLHPRSSLLTRALGTSPNVNVDLFEGLVQPGDRFVLASDGLMSMLPETRIREMLAGPDTPETLVAALIEAANEAGGYDNVTAIVVDASAGNDGAA